MKSGTLDQKSSKKEWYQTENGSAQVQRKYMPSKKSCTPNKFVDLDCSREVTPLKKPSTKKRTSVDASNTPKKLEMAPANSESSFNVKSNLQNVSIHQEGSPNKTETVVSKDTPSHHHEG
jgi:hypothetical protein